MLRIRELNVSNNQLRMKFSGREASDFLLAQRIFRYTLSAEFGKDSSFGYRFSEDDFELKEVPEHDYPSDRIITFSYRDSTGELEITWRPVKPKKI